MKKKLDKILFQIEQLSRINKILLLWYCFTFFIILVELFISHQLEEEIYFHPMISFLIRTLIIINMFFLPLILITLNTLRHVHGLIKKIVKIFFSCIVSTLITILFIVIISILDKSIFNSDTVKIEFENNIIYLENKVWLESKNFINVYEKENILFVRLKNRYKL